LIGLFITPILTPAISLLILCSILSILFPFNLFQSFSTFFALSIKNFVNLFTFWEPIEFSSLFIPLFFWSLIFLLYVWLLQNKEKRPQFNRGL
jgi:competence protein ComEC